MENQDLVTCKDAKEGLETVKYISIMQPKSSEGDVYLSNNTSNSTNPGNEAVQSCEDKEVYYEERHVPAGNGTCEQNEVIADKIVTNKMSIEVTSKKTRKSSRLLANDKKENLNKTNCSKVLKKKITKKPIKVPENKISDELFAMLCKKLESERHEKLMSSVRYVRPNNSNNALQYMPHGMVKQEELHHNYNLNNRNMLQYLDHNNVRHENLKQPVLMNPSPWTIVPKSGQNFILNNITNMQNQAGHTGFLDDKHNTYIIGGYLKQDKNPYFQSSTKSTDSNKLFGTENRVLHCSCNACTSQNWNNMHTGVEGFPNLNSAFQEAASNNSLNYIQSTGVSNNAWNPAIGSFNYFPNYQTLQADYNFKRLYYSGFNAMNNTNNSGYNVMANKNMISPLNNWNTYTNYSIPFNNSTNIVDTSVPSEPLPSTSFYADNTSTQFNNYYNKDMVDMSEDQYKGRDNFNPSILENVSLSAINTHGLDSDSTNTLSQNSSSTNTLSQNSSSTNTLSQNSNVSDFSSEPNIASGSEESSSYMYFKDMSKNWPSDI